MGNRNTTSPVPRVFTVGKLYKLLGNEIMVRLDTVDGLKCTCSSVPTAVWTNPTLDMPNPNTMYATTTNMLLELSIQDEYLRMSMSVTREKGVMCEVFVNSCWYVAEIRYVDASCELYYIPETGLVYKKAHRTYDVMPAGTYIKSGIKITTATDVSSPILIVEQPLSVGLLPPGTLPDGSPPAYAPHPDTEKTIAPPAY